MYIILTGRTGPHLYTPFQDLKRLGLKWKLQDALDLVIGEQVLASYLQDKGISFAIDSILLFVIS